MMDAERDVSGESYLTDPGHGLMSGTMNCAPCGTHGPHASFVSMIFWAALFSAVFACGYIIGEVKGRWFDAAILTAVTPQTLSSAPAPEGSMTMVPMFMMKGEDGSSGWMMRVYDNGTMNLMNIMEAEMKKAAVSSTVPTSTK